MELYMLWICVLLLFFNNPIKCARYEDDQNDNVLSNGEGSGVYQIKKKYVNYRDVQGHSKEFTPEFEVLLTEKENILEIKKVFKWEDTKKYPIEKYAKYWNNYCRSLWPGLPGYIPPELADVTDTLCAANIFPMPVRIRGKSYFKCFRHNIGAELDVNTHPFTGDFLCCECKYVKIGETRAMNGSRTYFYAMKFGEREYFLLTKIDKLDKKAMAQVGTTLKIVDYVNLPESKDIDLNA